MAFTRYLVAICDVLGFSNLVARESLERIHQRYSELLGRLEPSPIFLIDSKTGERKIVVNQIVFSDTVLFWAPAGNEMELLPTMLGQLMAASVGSLPLRIGLAFGECVIDRTKHIYIGQPIVDAYRTEQAQNWMGGAFHPSCWRHKGFLEFLCKDFERAAVRYPVPIVPGREALVPQLEYALNWPPLGKVIFYPEHLATQEARAPERDKAKWQNARRFYEAWRARPSS